MSITGADLSQKIRKLFSNQSLKVAPKLLNDTCDNSAVQPFLKWFCDNVGLENILQKEEVQLRKTLKENGRWLTGEELDAELLAVTRDCPQLLQLTQTDRVSDADVAKRYEAERESYDADIGDLRTLEESSKTLAVLELRLDEEIEAEEAQLERLKIQENKIYADCIGLVDEFDSTYRETYDDVQNVVRVYANAAERKGPPVVWTQVPLDLFIKEIENYNNYLKYYVNREFSAMQQEALSTSTYEEFPDDTSENCQNEKANELLTCQNDLITSTLHEIEARKELRAWEAMAVHAAEIYNNGDVRWPQSVAQVKVEMAELTSRRDVLEETNALMEARLEEAVGYYGKYVVTKILVENGQARLQRKKTRLAKIEGLLHFARDLGHAHSDLLAILMQLQQRKLREIVEFATDAKYYFTAEYSHASKRLKYMQEEQDKYNSIITDSPYKQNKFNELFSSLILGTETQMDVLNLSTKHYDELLVENKKMSEELLGDDLDRRIDILGPLERDVVCVYDHETSGGPTRSFQLMPYKILAQFGEVVANVEAAQRSVNEARKKFKDIMQKTANPTLEREKVILWQRFLTDPDTLKANYDQAQRIVDRSHFVSSLDS